MSKCTCGAHKTFGIKCNKSFHSDWCDFETDIIGESSLVFSNGTFDTCEEFIASGNNYVFTAPTSGVYRMTINPGWSILKFLKAGDVYKNELVTSFHKETWK